jgi:hypothetical protein
MMTRRRRKERQLAEATQAEVEERLAEPSAPPRLDTDMQAALPAGHRPPRRKEAWLAAVSILLALSLVYLSHLLVFLVFLLLGRALLAALTNEEEVRKERQRRLEKERQRQLEEARKERQRQLEEARTALYQAIHRMEDTARLDAECMRAVEEAMHEAAKYESRCEELAALVEFARTMVEQARAAERKQLEERLGELAMETQQVQAQLAVVAPAASAPQAEAQEALCLVCMDAPKRYAMVPCMHMCACEECAQQLLLTVTRSCPVCREPIQRTTRVFF